MTHANIAPDSVHKLADKLSPDLKKYWEKCAEFGLSAYQRMVYALVSLALFRNNVQVPTRGYGALAGMLVLATVVWTVVAFVQVTLGYLLFRWLLPESYAVILYVQLILNLALHYTLRWLFTEIPVGLQRKGFSETIHGLRLGRLDRALNLNSLMVGINLGNVLGVHTAMLYYLPNHMGIPEASSLGSAFLIALENFFRGVSLGFLFVHTHISLLGTPIHHTWSSATIFWMFRLVYAAIIGLMIFLAYRRWLMRRFYKTFPTSLNPKSLCEWIEQTCRIEDHWFRRYPDEFLFLMLVEEYLRGNDQLVLDISHQFPGLDVRNDVRELFVSPTTGRLLFELEEGQGNGESFREGMA